MRDKLRNHWGLAVILILYLAVASLYGATIPIFETPDSSGHYAYIHELTEGRGLPIHGTPSGERVTGYVAGHTPLYYALSAAATFWVEGDVDYADWAWRNPFHDMGNAGTTGNKNRLIHTSAEDFPWRGTPLTVHIARLVSTALGGLAVVAAYGMMLELFPDRRWLALGAAALTGFNPMFIFTSARVSNDAAVAGFGALVVWGGVRLAVRGLSRRGLALAGIALGLATLSKISGIILGPALALGLVLDALRVGHYRVSHLFRRDQLVRLLVNSLILFGVAALLCGWWFVRNLVLYGELMGTNAWLSHTATVRSEPIGLLEVIPFLKDLVISYWAMFGWFNIAAAPWMYQVWWVLVGLALVGLVSLLVDQWRPAKFARPVQAGLVVMVIAILLIFGSVYRFIMIVLGAQGRYLGPVTAAISVLLVLGLDRFLLRHFTPALVVGLAVWHFVVALICLFAFILPAYAGPEIVQESELPGDMMRFDMTFEETSVQLLGGTFDRESVQPGESVEVSLYWRTLEPMEEDPVAFVQILGRGADPIAGEDAYPGRGNLPISLWEPGVIYRDRYVLQIAPDAEAPSIIALYAGLRWMGGSRIPAVYPSGEPVSELALLDLTALRPSEPVSENVDYPVGARLGDAIVLVGYDLSADEVGAGDTLVVNLVWRAEAIPENDYTVFVHLLNENGDLVAQDDHPPLGNEYRTSFWAPGDIVRDDYHLALEADQAPCACTLQVGMYDPEAGVRLAAYDGVGTRYEGDAVVTGGVTVK
jgi:hypothetical protein